MDHVHFSLHTPPTSVRAITAAVADLLLATPEQPLGPLTVTRAVITAAGPGVPPTALTPVWEALPLGSHGDRGHTHGEYAAALLATDSDPDMDEALRRAGAGRVAEAAR